MARRGFTLIELLVVISIIALLSSVVLASLNAARDKARIAAGKQFSSQVDRVAGELAVGLWDFDECSGTAAGDRSGFGNNGTLMGGAAWSSDTPSGIGCSLSFDGIDDYVEVPNPSSINNGITQMTMSVWVKTSETGYNHIVSRGLNWTLGNIFLATDSDLGYTQFCFYTNGYSVKNCSGIAPDGKWHQLVGTYDGTQSSNNLVIYVDGIFRGTGTANVGTLANRTDSFRIANRNDALMNGLIDSVHIFSKVLTADQVKESYLAELSGGSLAGR